MLGNYNINITSVASFKGTTLVKVVSALVVFGFSNHKIYNSLSITYVPCYIHAAYISSHWRHY